MKAEKIELDFTKSKLREYLLGARTVYCPIESTDVLSASQAMADHREYNDFLIFSVSRRLRQSLFTYDDQLRKTCERLGIKTIQ
jgi:predicted nucleic acid-binding protein